MTGRSRSRLRIDLVSLLRGSSEPLQDRFFRHTQDKANVREGHFDQEHLQRHHDFLFWAPQAKEHGVARFREGLFTGATPEDTPFATLGEIGRDGANVASVYQPIMRTGRVGARLAPILGFAQGPILQSMRCAYPH